MLLTLLNLSDRGLVLGSRPVIVDDIRFVALLTGCLRGGGISLFELCVHQGVTVGAT